MTFGELGTRNLRAIRAQRKLSQEIVAKKAGISLFYVSMIERGLRTPPLDTLEALAKGLHVSPLDLLGPRRPGR